MFQQTLFDVEIDPAEEAARNLIRAYVKRGDDPNWIRDGQMGQVHPSGMYASIGGYIDDKCFGNDKIVVYRDMNGKTVNQVFSFQAIFEAVQTE